MPALPSSSSSSRVDSAPPAGPGIPNTEDAWIDTAREALSRGLPADCLRATNEHSRRYPNGALVEEREALAIQALAALGRRRQAGNRAGDFRKRWPDSLHLPAVDRSLR